MYGYEYEEDEEEDDNEFGLEDNLQVQNKDHYSELQQESFVTIEIQSDIINDNINLNEVHDDTPIRELLVNITRDLLYQIFKRIFCFS